MLEILRDHLVPVSPVLPTRVRCPNTSSSLCWLRVIHFSLALWAVYKAPFMLQTCKITSMHKDMKKKIHYRTQTDESPPTDFSYSISSKKTNFYDSSTGGITSALCLFFNIIPFHFFLGYLLWARLPWRPRMGTQQAWGPNPVIQSTVFFFFF